MKLTEAQILERIQAVYNSVTGNANLVLTPGTAIIKEKQINSFVLMELIVNLEEVFDIELPNGAIRSLKKVQNLIDLIQAQLKQ